MGKSASGGNHTRQLFLVLRPFPSPLPTESPREQRERLILVSALLLTPVWFALAIYEATERQWILLAANLALIGLIVSANLLRTKVNREAAINLTFWGATVLLAVAWALTTSEREIGRDATTIQIASIAVAAVVLIGLFAVRRYQIDVMFAVAGIANILWFLFGRHRTIEWVHFFVAYMAVLFVCYAAATFELKLSRIADDRLRANRVLRQQMEKLLFVENRARANLTECVEKFAHDVRSPLTVSLNISSLLLSSDLSEKQQKFVKLLKQSQEGILRLVENGLESCGHSVSGLDEIRTVRLGSFLADIVELHKTSTDNKDTDIEVRAADSLPSVDVPLTGLTRIVDNLLQNSLKYTAAGRIVVEADLEDKATEGRTPTLVVAVRDTGSGMSASRLAEVRKGTNGPDANISTSHGIGLSSCRSILSSCGGSMSIESTAGKGTEVTVRIPLARAATTFSGTGISGD